MKVLIATEKPFAPAAVEGIKKEVSERTDQSFESWKNIPKRNNFLTQWLMPMRLSSEATK